MLKYIVCSPILDEGGQRLEARMYIGGGLLLLIIILVLLLR